MKRTWYIFFLFVAAVLFPRQAFADTEHYFENPKELREDFLQEIYNEEYEVKYTFLREEVPVYTDQYGSKMLGKAEKYSGVMVVSETESYVQVIFEKEDGYEIGWMEKSQYKEHGKRYNGEEKQLLADGTYVMTSYSGDRFYYLELIFQGSQQYRIRSVKVDGYLDVHFDEEKCADGIWWQDESEKESQLWQLIREYDHFYVKNKVTGKYLVPRNEKGLGLLDISDEVKNVFVNEATKQASEEYWWTFERKFDKNVDSYRNFLQYDPDWSREDYGNVSDYSGKMAAAGCGAVVITNAVYALNGQFVDPMLFADFAVEEDYRMIGLGTDNGIFEAAAKEFGDAYDFHFVKQSYNIFEVKRHLERGCVAISHVPGHYISIVDYNEEEETYLVLDSHPIGSRPTSPFGDWFSWERLESGGLASQVYYIFSADDGGGS